ncbi:MAG TPA: NADH-quinone oxidoreductase subunit M [Thermoanaerobaculia bacterium]|nr:NADH-quinone oxidoreductase subunit M [Thermoanaerobaculia bacterium]
MELDLDLIAELLFGNSLTRLVLFPAVAALPLLFFPRSAQGAARGYALAVSLVELLLGVWYVAAHWGAGGSFTAVADPEVAWIPTFGIRYALVMDGISMPLVVLTVFLLPFVLLGSWVGVTRHWKGFAGSMLVLTTGILGTLLAWDLFLFYIFWEVMLVPMYLIIGIWGGERRVYAAVKFFLYTMAGSLLMLLAILWMAWQYAEVAGAWSFAYADLMQLGLPVGPQLWLFAAFFLAFAIKVPMFPFHTWLPDAHVEAPTGGSVILAGILLKLGTYGFLRFALPFFPQAVETFQPVLLALAVAGILYGALVAWVQVDMKKLVAYSSIAHLGFVMLGLFAVDQIAWEGALLQMVNHGLSTGALFLLVGMLYDRRHTKKFADFSGLAKVMPWFAFFLIFSALASVGLPGLNGFVGEFLILIGAYRAVGWWAVVATFGVVLAAVYLLKMLIETVWGPVEHEENRHLADLGLREIATLVPLAVLMLAIGVAPEPFLRPSRADLDRTLTAYQARLAEPAREVPGLRDVLPPGEEAAPEELPRAAALPADPVPGVPPVPAPDAVPAAAPSTATVNIADAAGVPEVNR